MTELKVTQKRHYSAHNDLLRIGGNYLFACENDERWCGEGYFVCLVMCALAVESLCNTAGELVFKDWRVDFEMCSPKAKIRILCEKLNIEYSRDSEPFATIHWLLKFRNEIAHAKPESIMVEELIARSAYEELMSSGGPQSKLEKKITIENARNCLSSVEQFKEVLAGNMIEENAWIIQSDSWEMFSEPTKNS